MLKIRFNFIFINECISICSFMVSNIKNIQVFHNSRIFNKPDEKEKNIQEWIIFSKINYIIEVMEG